MEQRRIQRSPRLPSPSTSSSSSSLLGINNNDELFELLQEFTAAGGLTPTRFVANGHIPAAALKMEPELGDFMTSSYTWGHASVATPLATQLATHGTQLLGTHGTRLGTPLETQFGTQLGTQLGTQIGGQLGTQLYSNAVDSPLTCLTNFTQQQQQLSDVATQFASFTPPAAAAASPPQIQALRDFMVYGNLAPSRPATTPGVANGALGFYHHQHQLEDVAVTDALHGSQLQPKDMSLAYRALCSEIYATERSPHRSQFQRENHILAERQRREEMNEKFSALRAMIPKATKKDKASIVGDTIDYVLELEKRLKQLQAYKDTASGPFFKADLKRKSRGEDGVTTMESPKGVAHTTSSPDTANAPLGSPLREAHSVASSPSDQITAESSKPAGKVKEAAAEVDVQQLGKQAVVKVVCNRRPGHVLRVLNALEECKVEVLQSNVMTVADNSIHFVTVQLEEGLSAPTEELISAVLQAINPAEP